MARALNAYDAAKHQGVLWSPKCASLNPVYWWDANDAQIDTGGVATWPTRGQAGAATQGTSGNRPDMLWTNSHGPSVSFTGSGDKLQFTRTFATGITSISFNHNSGEPFAVTVSTTATPANGGNSLPVAPHAGVLSVCMVSGQSYNNTAGVWLRQNGTAGSPVTTQAGIGSTPNHFNLFFCGTAADPGEGGQAQRIIEHSATAYLGGRSSNDRVLNGEIHELIVFGGPMATWERDALEGYLAWRWRYESLLVATHPYKSRPPLLGL